MSTYYHAPEGMINLDKMPDKVVQEIKHKGRPDETTYTYNKALGDLTALTSREVIYQSAIWKQLGAEVIKQNIYDMELPDGTKGTLFIVQPKNLEGTSMCPLAMSMGVWADGYGYFTTDERIARFIREHFAIDRSDEED